MNTEQILSERQQTHGSFEENAHLSQELKRLLRSKDGWNCMTLAQGEALDMICLKISRIMSGDANYRDHWDDIAGYATLISRTL